MTGKVRVFVLTVIAVLIWSAHSCVYADEVKSKIYLGIRQQETANGVTITVVEPKSPAAQGGLLPGDIILSINSVPVKTSKELVAISAQTLIPYTPAVFTIQRGGAVQQITATPTGILRLEIKDLQPRQFVIPGVPDKDPPAPASPVEAMEQINVIKQVIIDAGTGKVELVGMYDERFATGPIPYLDLLKTALQYPAPGFTLNLRPETQAALQELTKKSSEPVTPQTVATKALLLLYGHPGLERERQALVKAYAAQFDITPHEYAVMYNYLTLDNTTGVVPPEVGRIQEKIFRHLGYSSVADAYAVLAGGTPEAATKALQILGRTPGEYPGSLMVQVHFAIQEKLNQKVVQWAIDRRTEVDRQNQTELLIRLQRQILPEWDQSRQKNVNINVLRKLILSNEASQILGDIPQPVESELLGKDIDATSQLYRILYEADYALKSRDVFPELFANVPGAQTFYEYMAATAQNGQYEKFKNPVRVWLEPGKVEMEFSPDKKVVTFGNAEIRMLAHILDQNTLKDKDFPENFNPDVNWDGWCSQLANNYDAYASIMPSYHKLREAAKIIALARWIQAERVTVDLASVQQEKWTAPAKVPGFWAYGFTFQLMENGATNMGAWRYTAFGGVSFKGQSHWTKYTPSVTSETKVSSQLALSAGLGQKAVIAAQSGNLENAKYLAELSAQAMIGSLSKQDIAKMNIIVPDVKAPVVASANVQLQKEMIKKTYQQIAAVKSKQTSPDASAATLAQLNNLYDQVNANPAAASDYLKQLQTGQLPVPGISKPPEPPAPDIKIGETVCSESTLGTEKLSAERKAYLTQKLSDARNRLKYINEALRKLIAINVSQQAEINKLTAEITAEYEAAQERAYDFAVGTLIDVPLAKYADIHATKIKAMKNEITALIGKSTTPLSEAERKLLQREIELKMSLVSRYEEAFQTNEQALKQYNRANNAEDIYRWDQETRDAGLKKRGLEAAKVAATMFLESEWLEEYLSKKDWFGGNKMWQVLTMGKMAAYGSGFFWDIMNQYGAWQPHIANLQNGMTVNTQAMEYLRQKAQQTSQEIDCFERLLK